MLASKEETNRNVVMEHVKETQEPTERAPNAQSWNNQSNQVLDYSTKYKINTHESILIQFNR
jgi:hypothetical protein